MNEAFRKPPGFPLIWLVLTVLAMYGLDGWFPLRQVVVPPYHWIGLAFAVPGVLMVLHAGRSFLMAGTGLVPFSEATTLVTGGLYRFSRNPMYLAMLLFLIGLAVFLGTLSTLIPVALFAWIIDRQFIRSEEIFLEGIFGDEYAAYRQRVRRWI